MTDLTAYADIRRRLAEATGPFVDGVEAGNLAAAVFARGFREWELLFRALQGSLDAALALVEEKLPDHQVSSANFTREFVDGKWERGKAWAAIWTPDNRQITRKGAVTQALAVLSALFAALESSHD